MKIAYQKILGLSFGKLLSGAVVALALASCTTDPNSPGIEYMPDMYRSPSYEPYIKVYDLDSAEFFERNYERLGLDINSPDTNVRAEAVKEVAQLWEIFKTGRMTYKPVDGTVSRGHKPFSISRENKAASKSLAMPIAYTKESLNEGKAYYEIFCDHCHGKKGDGNGPMVAKEVYTNVPPNYASGPASELTAGEIYHTIYYGKGAMGPHASQISEDKRWKLVQYVQTLQGKKLEDLQGAKQPVQESDSSNVASPDSTNKG